MRAGGRRLGENCGSPPAPPSPRPLTLILKLLIRHVPKTRMAKDNEVRSIMIFIKETLKMSLN